MGTSGKGAAIVGYNVQTAVDTQHHLIVAHDITNVGHDRDQLSNMAGQAKAAMGRCSMSWPTAATSRARRFWPRALGQKENGCVPRRRRTRTAPPQHS
jgi:hypothetical protein